jgi:alkylation response protein AidB-like acyl-CoA dehydrogenase
MDLDPTPELQERYEHLAAVGRGLAGDMVARDRDLAFSRAGWKACAEEGVLGLPIPAEYGGAGLDPLDCAYLLEGLGHGCTDLGLLISIGAHLWAGSLPVLRFGTPEQRRRWLPGMCDGSTIAAHAITEPEAGSDSLAVRATASRDGDEYLLTGQKRFITNGPIADVFIVYATINPMLGFTGVTAFLVERDQPGLTITSRHEKMGLRTSPWAELTLDGCRVRERLGAEKQGRKVFSVTMAWERALILAPLVGVMLRQINECVDHVRSRRQFGQHLGAFDPVAYRIAEMRRRAEAARWLTYQAAAKLRTEETSLYSELAQLETSEAAVANALDAMQVFGGLGYTVGAEVERVLRDVLGTRISSGTSDMQRGIIAGKMGLRQALRAAGTRA